MMALEKCKSCGKEVAESAKKCPHCGETLSWGIGKRVVAGIFAMMVIGAVANSVQNADRQDSEPARAYVPPPPTQAQIEQEQTNKRALSLAVSALKVWRETLKDPSSASVSKAKVTQPGAVCLIVRAKNGFGAFVPSLIVIASDGKWSVSEDLDAAFKKKYWDPNCHNAPGFDAAVLLAQRANMDLN